MLLLEEIRLTVVDNFAMESDNDVISASSVRNDRVERSASFFRNALKYDLAIIAAHNAQLASSKFKNSAIHVDISTVDNLRTTGG